MILLSFGFIEINSNYPLLLFCLSAFIIIFYSILFSCHSCSLSRMSLLLYFPSLSLPSVCHTFSIVTLKQTPNSPTHKPNQLSTPPPRPRDCSCRWSACSACRWQYWSLHLPRELNYYCYLNKYSFRWRNNNYMKVYQQFWIINQTICHSHLNKIPFDLKYSHFVSIINEWPIFRLTCNRRVTWPTNQDQT